MICKNCGKDNLDGATVCVRCFKMLENEKNISNFNVEIDFKKQPKPVAVQKKANKNYITCDKCNAKNPDNYLNCRLCGNSLYEINKSKKINKKKIAIILTALIMVIVAVVCAVMFYFTPKAKVQEDLITKTFGVDESNTFLNTIKKYVDIEVKGYSTSKIVVVVTSADISEEFLQSNGYATDAVIEEALTVATFTPKEITLNYDENGNLLLSYEYFNVAYCGLLDAYYDMMGSIVEEMVK